MIERLREWCLELPGAFEDFPFGPENSVMKVQATGDSSAKMFAMVFRHKGNDSINIKCDPELAIAHRAGFSEVVPGYHMNKKHWNSVHFPADWDPEFSALSHALIRDMIEDSYDLVVSALPKNDRILLAWPSER